MNPEWQCLAGPIGLKFAVLLNHITSLSAVSLCNLRPIVVSIISPGRPSGVTGSDKIRTGDNGSGV